MTIARKNKERVIAMVNTISHQTKDRKLLVEFVADEMLLDYLLFLESLFPAFNLLIDELTAEANRLVLRVRLQGIAGAGIKAVRPQEPVEFPMVFGFEMEKQKIVHHWLIADQAKLLQQISPQ
jgi:predicted ester cyclase